MAQLPRPAAPARPAASPSDRTLYEETENVAFTVGVGRTQDRRCILIQTGENSSNEIRFVPADNAEAPPVLIARAPAEHPIFGRFQPRQALDPDQRRPRQFPPRRGRRRTRPGDVARR